MEKSGKGKFVSFKKVCRPDHPGGRGQLLVVPGPPAAGRTRPSGWHYTPQVLCRRPRPRTSRWPCSSPPTGAPPARSSRPRPCPTPRCRPCSAHFVPVKADLTSDPGPAAQKIMRQYRVRGVPTMIFLDGKGKEITESRLVGFHAGRAPHPLDQDGPGPLQDERRRSSPHFRRVGGMGPFRWWSHEYGVSGPRFFSQGGPGNSAYGLARPAPQTGRQARAESVTRTSRPERRPYAGAKNLINRVHAGRAAFE